MTILKVFIDMFNIYKEKKTRVLTRINFSIKLMAIKRLDFKIK